VLRTAHLHQFPKEVRTTAERCDECGCHSGDPAGPWPLTSYEHVAEWASEIRAQMAACTMPPADAGSGMPPEEREKILLWIRCGARN
jgi:uncharacterized membrane protein